ncbi:MAG: V-type ATP synthase subunit B, partial [Candidatus Omnitrophota bacterium]|nr:V-type ATP synthase subunit B [Candidatus Omnitrophota bacterium]
SDYRSTLEKRSMGFQMSNWDHKLLNYGKRFENELMDLSVNIPLEEALDLGWKILADCFDPHETGIKDALIKQYWPKMTVK